MICGTRRRVSGWPEVWTRRRCRPGWGTPRSPREHLPCTSWGRAPTAPDWTVSTHGGTHGAHVRARRTRDAASGNEKGTVPAGGRRCLSGGAEGIRTPDLLIANETRYQLRHSPETPVEPARAEKIPPGSASPESGQEPTARCCSVSAATSASASSAAARATIWVSSAVRPDVQVPGSPRSMVRTVRLALGLET